MGFVKNWDDFEIAAENMYIQNPTKCRYTMKYIHNKGHLLLKLTDNEKVRKMFYTQVLLTFKLHSFKSLQCVQYKTDIMPDLKKIEKFTGNLMSHMTIKNE